MAISKTSNKSTTQGTKVDFMKGVNNLGMPLAAVTGFAIGKIALKKLDKTPAVNGLMGPDMKGLIIPAAVTLGGVIAGTQFFKKNQLISLGMIGIAGAGVEAGIKKLTGKTMLAGLEGLMGTPESNDEEITIPPHFQQLPAADVDVENAIQRAINGASDFSMSDEPVGSAADFSMSDEPMGKVNPQASYPYHEVDELEVSGNSDTESEKISEDADLFAGDMMAD